MKRLHQKNAFLVFNTSFQKGLHSYFKWYSGIPFLNQTYTAFFWKYTSIREIVERSQQIPVSFYELNSLNVSNVRISTRVYRKYSAFFYKKWRGTHYCVTTLSFSNNRFQWSVLDEKVNRLSHTATLRSIHTSTASKTKIPTIY